MLCALQLTPLHLRSSFGDWSAWVSVDGEPVEVYSVEHKPDINKTTCFIEAKDAKAFTVSTRCDHVGALPTDMCTHVLLDGVRCD